MADTPEFERKLNRAFWNAGSRSILKLEILDSRVLKKARDHRRVGAYRECLEELKKDPAAANDPEALITAALTHFGLGDCDASLLSLSEAENRLLQRLCDVHVNYVPVLLAKGMDKEAEDHAWMAINLNPAEPAAWINLMAARRHQPESITEIVREMDRRWPEWSKQSEMKRTILDDVMLRHVRELPDFDKIFASMLEV